MGSICYYVLLRNICSSLFPKKKIKSKSIHLFYCLYLCEYEVSYNESMRDESGAIHLQHQDVVHHSYLLALYKLNHALMAKHIYL